MFYSHEVLTSRKYGVATVWLVATLGAKSNTRKLGRKAILDVDVAKACQTIVDPKTPMALRLQGSLLYGVTRVYLQQAGYALSDAQNAHAQMQSMFKAVMNEGIDPDAGKARPEQLILQDDPSFLPEFALPSLDLLMDIDVQMPLTTTRPGESQSLTPFGSQQAPGTPQGPVGGLMFPSSSSRGGGDFFVQGDDGPGALVDPNGVLEEENNRDDLVAADFEFDEDGYMRDLTPGQIVTPGLPREGTVPSDAGASARVRREHEEGRRAGVEALGDKMDFDLPMLGDDLPEGEAFPSATEEQTADRSDSVEATAVAPMRRKQRTRRVIPPDFTMELRNADLADWNNNYLQNMEQASKKKNEHRAIMQAKKNAEFWVWGAGLGGIGARIGGATAATPFDRFIGDNLFELVTGIKRKSLNMGVAGTKHDRDSGIDEQTEAESRRVRRKKDQDQKQIGRDEEDGVIFAPDEEVELPRDAPSALDDHQLFSAMPWNMSASVRGSSAIPRSGRHTTASATGPRGSLRQRHGSRMVSASPLKDRGQPRPGGLEALRSLEGEDEYGSLGPDDFGLPGGPDSDDFPPAADTGPSARVRDALSAEGENFLVFVADAITEKRQLARDILDPLQADAAASVDEVLFEEILPPGENSRTVAAQGLMMVLALGTKGLLDVRQDGLHADIGLSLTEKAREVQEGLAEGQEGGGGEEREEEMEDVAEEAEEHEEEGQFEDQMAGLEAQAPDNEDDDNWDLYED